MTQLVELQKRYGELQEAGYEVYAISYDQLPAVQAFAERQGITFQMLSDEDSEVIERFGILNTLIDADDESKHPSGQRFYGIPFPGTYIVDEDGVVSEKFFNQHYANRVSAGTLLDSALGEVFLHEESPAAELDDELAKVTAFLADPALRLEVESTLYVRIETGEGLHIYGEPLPENFIATAVTVGEVEGLRFGEPHYPATTPREFPELGVTLSLYEGTTDIAIPVTAEGALLGFDRRDKPESVTIPVSVLYQACTETVCHRPRTVDLEVEVPLAGLVMSNR